MISRYKYSLWLILLGSVFFIPFLGASHLFDWDEVNFAECAREMLVTNDYTTVQIDFEPFWEKPPLFMWLQALSMKIFGITEFAARLPNAIAGVLIMLVLFNVGKKFFDEKFGLYFSLSYFGGWLAFMYSKSGIIDPWFNLFMFLSIYFMILVYSEEYKKRIKNVFLSAFFASLATLTKGPVGILIPMLTYFFALFFHEGVRRIISIKEIIVFVVTLLVVGGSWFFILIVEGKYEVIVDFILYQIRLFSTQDAGHGGPFYYHFVVLLLGFFPLSFFAIYGMKKSIRKNGLSEKQQKFSGWMFILFWVVVILFSIVKTKIIHYSSMAYYPIAFFSALAFYRMKDNELKSLKLIRGLTFLVAFLWSLAIALLPFVEKHKNYILQSNIIGDVFAKESFATMYAGFDYSITFLSFVFVLLFGWIIFWVKDKRSFFLKIILVSAIFLEVVIVYVVPKVEVYSQRSAIDFYKQFKKQNVYIYPLGFKSYSHLFYAQKPYGLKKIPIKSLLRCESEYPVYFVAKINKAEEIENKFTNLRKMYSKGGFVFFELQCNSEK